MYEICRYKEYPEISKEYEKLRFLMKKLQDTEIEYKKKIEELTRQKEEQWQTIIDLVNDMGLGREGFDPKTACLEFYPDYGTLIFIGSYQDNTKGKFEIIDL